MNREDAMRMVRNYGAAIEEGRRADAAEFGMELTEALMRIPSNAVMAAIEQYKGTEATKIKALLGIDRKDTTTS
jgi:hypothetical protein